MNVTVFLAENADLVRIGIVQVLEESSGLQVIGQAASGAQLFEQVTELQPDIIVLSWELPKLDHAKFIAKLSKTLPGTKILMLLPRILEWTAGSASLQQSPC